MLVSWRVYTSSFGRWNPTTKGYGTSQPSANWKPPWGHAAKNPGDGARFYQRFASRVFLYSNVHESFMNHSSRFHLPTITFLPPCSRSGVPAFLLKHPFWAQKGWNKDAACKLSLPNHKGQDWIHRPPMCHWHASESHLPQCQGPYDQLVGRPNSEISRISWEFFILKGTPMAIQEPLC